MNLYRWNSELLREYGTGDIIAIANSVEEARSLVRDRWNPTEEGGPTENIYLRVAKELNDEDFEKQYEEKRLLLESDIAGEPDLIAGGILFIRGSE